jgi:hypothetical protein
MTRRPDRVTKLLSHRPLTGIAVEVAPYFNPALPKAAGHDVLILDVFDTKTLRDRAQASPDIPNERIVEIEDVDVVGDASAIGELLAARGLAGKVGFVVSSHNFEHLPDPIRFLRGVEASLMPGGVLSMAIPDCRSTFDHFRSMTRLVDWLTAFHDGHSQPTPNSLFDLRANEARFPIGSEMRLACDWGSEDPGIARLVGDLHGAYATWLEARTTLGDYTDCHVSVVFDAQFRLMVEDLRQLGLISLEILEITGNHGHEFFAHLRRPVTAKAPLSTAEYQVRREKLVRNVTAAIGDDAFPFNKQPFAVALRPKSVVRRIIGGARFDKIKLWNRARKARRKKQA